MTITSFSLAGMPTDETERQHATEKSGILGAVGDPSLMELAKVARLQSRAETALICAVSAYNVFVVAQDGVRPGVFSRTRSFVGHMIMNRLEVLVVPDAKKDSDFAGNTLVENGDVSFYAAAALRDNSGQTIGAVCVTSRKPKLDWKDSDSQHLRDVAGATMHLLETRSYGIQ
jgi:hypothetical protein